MSALMLMIALCIVSLFLNDGKESPKPKQTSDQKSRVLVIHLDELSHEKKVIGKEKNEQSDTANRWIATAVFLFVLILLYHSL